MICLTSLTSVLVFPIVETAKKLDKMLNGSDKKILYEALTALQEVLEEIEKQKSSEMELSLK